MTLVEGEFDSEESMILEHQVRQATLVLPNLILGHEGLGEMAEKAPEQQHAGKGVINALHTDTLLQLLDYFRLLLSL